MVELGASEVASELWKNSIRPRNRKNCGKTLDCGRL
jgi:hypothetical protein